MNTPRLLPRPFTPIGFYRDGRPIYPVIGASVDVDLDIEPDVEDEEVDQEPAEGEEPEKRTYTAPAEAEWHKVQAALAKSNASAKQRRQELAASNKRIQELEDAAAVRDAEAEREKLGGKPKDTDKDAAPALPDGVMTPAQIKLAIAQARRDAAKETTDKFRDVTVKSAAAAALSQAGVVFGNVKKLTRLLELDDIELDEDGEIAGGLDEQIAALREELPQLFKTTEEEAPKAKSRPRPPRIPLATAAGQQEAAPPPLTSAQKMAAQVLGTNQ